MTTKDDYRSQAKARGLETADDADQLARHMRPVYDRLLTPWLPPSRNATIHEVACGPGIMLRYLRMRGYCRIEGSDSSEYQIALARASGVPVKLTDSIQELANHDVNMWDCLIAIDFIEHLPKDRIPLFIMECHRTLKPGGCLILRLPNGDSPLVGRHLFNDITHHWTFTTVALRTLLVNGGFDMPVFADEAIASIEQYRWLKVPLMKASQAVWRGLIRAATRETVKYFSPSLYVCARKPSALHDLRISVTP